MHGAPQKVLHWLKNDCFLVVYARQSSFPRVNFWDGLGRCVWLWILLTCLSLTGCISNGRSAMRYQTIMPPRRKLTDFERAQATAWLQDRVGVREVARRLGVSHLTQSSSDSVDASKPLAEFKTGHVRVDQGKPQQEKIASSRDTPANVIRHHLRAARNTHQD